MHRHHRPPPRRALDFQPSAMHFRQPYGERKPQPRPFEPARKAVVDLPEEFERLADFVAGHSYPRVSDRKTQTSLRIRGGRDIDAAAGRGELDRVGQKINQDLLDLVFVGIDGGAGILGRPTELNSASGGLLLNGDEAPFDDRGHLHPLFVQLKLTRLYPCDIKNIVDDGQEVGPPSGEYRRRNPHSGRRPCPEAYRE